MENSADVQTASEVQCNVFITSHYIIAVAGSESLQIIIIIITTKVVQPGFGR